MGLLSRMGANDYAGAVMPATKIGDGPWGDALKHLLRVNDKSQADLARETGIEEKTISKIARGFHCNTRKLALIAKVLKVSIEDVLLSPERRYADEARKRMIQEAVENAWRNSEKPGVGLTPAVVFDNTMNAKIKRDQKQRQSAARKRKRRTVTRKVNHKT